MTDEEKWDRWMKSLSTADKKLLLCLGIPVRNITKEEWQTRMRTGRFIARTIEGVRAFGGQ